MTETIDNISIRNEVSKWHNKDYDNKEKTFKLPLVKSFTLLKMFDVQLARDYFADRKLDNAKDRRNNSILAHGLEPLDEEAAEDFYNRVLSYSKKSCPNIEKYMKLAKFPRFSFS